MTAAGAVLVSASSQRRAEPYVEALKAGGIPAELIRVVEPASGTADLNGAAGLLLCGGADVAPQRYGETPLAGAGLETLPERDALEWGLLAAARERRLPVWGVCRGLQVLNVFLGGSLWQDLPLQRQSLVAHDPGAPNDLLAHAVQVTAPQLPLGSRLASGRGGGPGNQQLVNSRHHQAVRRLAPALQTVAVSADGLVEAAQLAEGSAAGADGPWWVHAVQWHPENLLDLPEQLQLWRDFAAAVSA